MSKRYLIIGDGAAGTTAAQYLRGADPHATITIFSDDPNAAYYRSALTNYLLGELREEQIWAVPQTFYEDFRINRLLARVTQIDTRGSQLYLSQGGRPESYDALVVGAGSRARPPTFQGADLPGVMVMRTLADVRKVVDLIKLRGLKQAVVVGGGPLALEWAHGLNHRGVKVTLMVRESRFLPGAIDALASDLLLARLRHGGVDVRAGDEVVAAMPGRDGRVAGVVTKSGAQIPCELVACGIGVICNSDFLQNSGIALEKNGGIMVDERLQTSIPNIYAAGDIAAVRGKLLQLWEPARHQARVAALQITGSKEQLYTPGVHYMATRLYDLDVASIGHVTGASPEAQTVRGAEEIIDFPQHTGHISYRKLCIRDGKLIGALVFGQREARVRKWGRQFKQLIDEQVDVSEIKRDLQDPMFDLSAWMQKNELIGKPSQSPSTQQSPQDAPKVQKFKRTAAINLADLPPLPVAGVNAIASAPQGRSERTDNGTQMTRMVQPGTNAPAPAVTSAAAAPLKKPGTQALAAFLDPKDLPRVLLDGPRGRFELMQAVAIVGSDPQCAIPLDDADVSYTHAQISRSGAAVYVRDLGTAGGTWVNGAASVVPTKLRDGDKIRVGKSEIVVRIEARAGAAPLSTFVPAPAPSAALSAQATPHLEVRAGQSLGLGFELVPAPAPLRIGRDPHANIRLDDPSIAPQHAVLHMAQGQWMVADATGRGAVAVNGAVLPPGSWMPMKTGDSLQLGEVVLLFVMRQAYVARDHLSRGSVAPPPPRISAPPPPPRPSQQPPPPPRPSYQPPSLSSASSASAVQPPRPMGTMQSQAAPPIPSRASIATPPPMQPPPPPREIRSQQIPSMQMPSMQRPSAPPPMHRPSAPPAPPPPMSFAAAPRGRITLRHPQGQSQLPELGDHTVFGSQQGACHFVVPDPAVFPAHLEIVKRPDGFWARALDPRIGTSWRGQMIGPAPIKLTSGDVLMLGPRVTLYFEGNV